MKQPFFESRTYDWGKSQKKKKKLIIFFLFAFVFAATRTKMAAKRYIAISVFHDCFGFLCFKQNEITYFRCTEKMVFPDIDDRWENNFQFMCNNIAIWEEMVAIENDTLCAYIRTFYWSHNLRTECERKRNIVKELAGVRKNTQSARNSTTINIVCGNWPRISIKCLT